MSEHDTLWLDYGKNVKNADFCSAVFGARTNRTEQKWAIIAINVQVCSDRTICELNKDRRFSIFPKFGSGGSDILGSLNNRSLTKATRELAATCPEMAKIYSLYGPPPLWDREPGFATLLQIILEQQVSLASAKACFDKLAAHLGNVTPETVLSLSDVELKAVGFSRQKTAYARHLAEAIIDKHIDLDSLFHLPDAEVKAELIKLKGVGEWTSDIYLLMALLRPDVMPKGDIALHSAWHNLSGEPRPSSDEFLVIAERWKPLRSVAARLLWHFYLCEKVKKVNGEKA